MLPRPTGCNITKPSGNASKKSSHFRMLKKSLLWLFPIATDKITPISPAP
jgi:hypothetical protein